MALSDLDPRNGGPCINLLSKKFWSYVCAYVQLVFWICGLLTMIFNPSSLGAVIENQNTASIIIAVLLMLFSLLFCILLVVGLHKNRQRFIQSYLVYLGVHTVLLVLFFIINIFLQPNKIGFRGFFSTIIVILLHILFFIVVRGYYLVTYCARATDPNPKGASIPPV